MTHRKLKKSLNLHALPWNPKNIETGLAESSAQIKTTEHVPQGLTPAEKPERYRIEDSCLDMKGKRMDSVRTEKVKSTFKPRLEEVLFGIDDTILKLRRQIQVTNARQNEYALQ